MDDKAGSWDSFVALRALLFSKNEVNNVVGILV